MDEEIPNLIKGPPTPFPEDPFSLIWGPSPVACRPSCRPSSGSYTVGEYEARGGAVQLTELNSSSTGLCLCRTSTGSVLPAWSLFWSDHAGCRKRLIRIDDPGSRPSPRCFCSKKVTFSTRGTLPCEEFRHKQRRQSPASMRGWRPGVAADGPFR